MGSLCWCNTIFLFKFVWRQSEFAFFGALTSVGALFYFQEEGMQTFSRLSKEEKALVKEHTFWRKVVVWTEYYRRQDAITLFVEKAKSFADFPTALFRHWQTQGEPPFSCNTSDLPVVAFVDCRMGFWTDYREVKFKRPRNASQCLALVYAVEEKLREYDPKVHICIWNSADPETAIHRLGSTRLPIFLSIRFGSTHNVP